MGISIHSLQLIFTLSKDGYFRDCKSVIEIGSQDIHSNHGQVMAALERLDGLKHGKDEVITPEALYKTLGFERYQCIDADGRHNALVFDLNKDIRQTYHYSEQFDLVTNHGTTEHCFDQLHAFQNIHNLCAVGGLMIHGLPFQGYLNHGFYNYQPSFFYDLAAANSYSLIGLYLNIDSTVGDITPYSDELMNFILTPPGTNMLLFVVLKKTLGQEFRIPFNGIYLESNLFKDDYKRDSKQFFPGDRRATDITLMPSKQIARVLLRRIARKVFGANP